MQLSAKESFRDVIENNDRLAASGQANTLHEAPNWRKHVWVSQVQQATSPISASAELHATCVVFVCEIEDQLTARQHCVFVWLGRWLCNSACVA